MARTKRVTERDRHRAPSRSSDELRGLSLPRGNHTKRDVAGNVDTDLADTRVPQPSGVIYRKRWHPLPAGRPSETSPRRGAIRLAPVIEGRPPFEVHVSALSTLYSDHHRVCDAAFADAEAAGVEGRWPDAEVATTRFAGLIEAIEEKNRSFAEGTEAVQ